MHKARLNERKKNIDQIKDETKNMRRKTDDMKTNVANQAKELQGLFLLISDSS